METVDLTAAREKLNAIAEARRQAKAGPEALLKQLQDGRDRLAAMRNETMAQVQTRIESIGADGLIVSSTIPGIMGGAPPKASVVLSNAAAIRRRTQAIHAELIPLDNLIHALKRILFAREGFSQAVLNRAISLGEIPADGDAHINSIIERIPPATADQFDVIHAPKD